MKIKVGQHALNTFPMEADLNVFFGKSVRRPRAIFVRGIGNVSYYAVRPIKGKSPVKFISLIAFYVNYLRFLFR